MPRKTSENAVPAAETKKKAPSTAKKTTRSRETKTKAEETKTKKTSAKTTEKKTTVRKPRTKKEAAPEKKEKIETVEAEIVQEKGGIGVNGNLIPLNKRSKKVQREIQEKGRQKNKENWKRRKEIRQALCDFLDDNASPVLWDNMEKLGVREEDRSNCMAMFAAAFSKGAARGDLNAIRTIMEYAGRAPLQEMRENEAIARMSQVIQLAKGMDDENEDLDEDVIFYIPENGRTIITDDVLNETGEEV